MADQREDLAETVFNRPELVQLLGGINEHTVLLYFAESQFFDSTSNNASLLTQSQYNQSMARIRESRHTFEDALRSMSGLEFMIVNEGSISEFNDVWIIKKQNRQRGLGPMGQNAVTALATYYVVGESIYMAPAVGNILESKVFSITASLNSLFTLASSLPRFVPGQGHTYLEHSEILGRMTSGRQVTQPNKGSFSSAVSESRISGRKPRPTRNAVISDTRVLSESFRSLLQYRNEYMDENPLRGEPGSFVLSTTKEHLQQQALQKTQGPKLRTNTNHFAMFQSSISHLQEETSSTRKVSKGQEEGAFSPEARPKAKRRKSKVVQTPTTPA